LERFRKAGIAPSSDMLAQLTVLDKSVINQNDISFEIAKVGAEAAKASADAATASAKRLETIKIGADLGATIGEALTGYPGAIESSGTQFGFFLRQLPSSSMTGKRISVADIQEVQGGVASDDPVESQKSALRIVGLTSDLRRGRMNDKQQAAAAKASSDFTSSVSALDSIVTELRKQGSESGSAIDFVRSRLAVLGLTPESGELKAENIHSLFMMGSLRETVVGPGNPAIYEQLLLRSGIPQTGDFLSVPNWEAKKAKTLSLVMVSGYIANMQQNGMVPTQDSIDDINAKMKPIFGDKYVPFTLDELTGAKGWMNVRNNEREARTWLASRVDGSGNRQYMTADELDRARTGR
jgi:hypothetical protein